MVDFTFFTPSNGDAVLDLDMYLHHKDPAFLCFALDRLGRIAMGTVAESTLFPNGHELLYLPCAK